MPEFLTNVSFTKEALHAGYQQVLHTLDLHAGPVCKTESDTHSFHISVALSLLATSVNAANEDVRPIISLGIMRAMLDAFQNPEPFSISMEVRNRTTGKRVVDA